MDVLVVPGFARAGRGLARGVTVMPGLVRRSSRASVCGCRASTFSPARNKKDVDGRVKPGHDHI
ncbi:MAG: hypothetical protein WA759_14890, partial [Pseudolabrys sp.]